MFLSEVPLGHLNEEMFEVISCYYPIDFHPSPNDPEAVTRQELANALCPCLCAIPEFGELCMVLLIEKLDSHLRLAKLDSLQLLTESCRTFKADSYAPFLRTLWTSIQREIFQKTDDELNMAAHKALSALVTKLSITVNTDQGFESFVKGILISIQTRIAESTTAIQFLQAVRVLLTTANAAKEACVIIAAAMIPAAMTFSDFNSSQRLQIGCLEFLGDLYAVAKHWDILHMIKEQIGAIPQHCLNAVSMPVKEFQIAGFKLLIKVINELQSDLVLPFVEVLIHNVQYSHESDLLSISVETVHVIARKYPELTMSLVVKGKCHLNSVLCEKKAVEKRLLLLSNLASIDDFTKIIIEEMLKVVTNSQDEAGLKCSVARVVEALSESISNSNLFSEHKVAQIESDHSLIDSVLAWIFREIQDISHDKLSHGYQLISHTMSSLPREKQQQMLCKHAPSVLEKCKQNEKYLFILESLYSSVDHSVFDDTFQIVLSTTLDFAVMSDNEIIRTKACGLCAHFLNKAEYGPKFELLYDELKKYLSMCPTNNQNLCTKLTLLYAWIAKALVMRGSDLFLFWLQKILVALSSPDYSRDAAEALHVIMTDSPDYLTPRHHCRVSLLYKQRMFQSFSKLAECFIVKEEIKESYMLSWAYILAKTPKTVLNDEVEKIVPLVIDSLVYGNKELLLVMVDILTYFVKTNSIVASSLQTVLPRLVKLSQYVESMDIRIKSLQCLYEIANCYRTIYLLPYKQDVLFDLAPALDDKKRLVRNTAVKARTRWFLIGAPGEAKEN
ncbi:MMS19 nucleotide excision repair protein homolog isoform X2 [Hyposmocoma kahamanoa]|nr:MMS19 nucleotide excision repair protein homolog isoform X2 [Hyposmocoma kahamanoa]